MSDKEVIRGAINQAHENYKNSNVLSGEVAILSVIFGLIFKSWWVFGGAFFGFFILMSVPYLGSGLLLLLSLLWGMLGWELGAMFSSVGAKVALGLISFFAGLHIHFSGRQWFKDKG